MVKTDVFHLLNIRSINGLLQRTYVPNLVQGSYENVMLHNGLYVQDFIVVDLLYVVAIDCFEEGTEEKVPIVVGAVQVFWHVLPKVPYGLLEEVARREGLQDCRENFGDGLHYNSDGNFDDLSGTEIL